MKFGNKQKSVQKVVKSLMYKSNDFKKSELLERLKGERSLLVSSPNLTDDIWEELERLDNVINDLQYEIWNSDLN